MTHVEIELRPMSAAEYREYVGWSVKDYADEVQRNTRVDPANALRHAQRTFDQILPDGLATKDHRLLTASLPDGQRVGLLWIARQRREGIDAAWIYDVMVEEPLRGRGYGRRLMELAEEQARDLGVHRIELNVFGDNERARGLYGSIGYVEMSRQLYKDLPPA